MRKWLTAIFGGRLQKVLIASFALVAGLTIGLDTLVTSRLIKDYLAREESNLVDRDMDLAKGFYHLKLDEIEAISHRLSLDPWVNQHLAAAVLGDARAREIMDQQIVNKISILALGGTHFICILDARGRMVAGRVLTQKGSLTAPISRGEWKKLDIVQGVLETGKPQAATEVIPKELLAQVGLERQAFIPLKETPMTAPDLFDPLEGTAGLAMTGVYPIYDENSKIKGAVLSIYLFNNDFTLVDRIKDMAGIDTVTIFFGDLRVSTNVMNEEGDRAVGTRISQTVHNVVLSRGRDYVGRAYVVNEWFITRYAPLLNSRGRVVGSLYVGAKESSFLALVRNFNKQVVLIALICLLLAGVIAIPIARLIIKPIDALVQANQQLAQGDMAVRVKAVGKGELADLGHSFNSMVETLDRTQQELVHKEKLASMGQLAAGVAHEINNPLGSILLFADTMHHEAGKDHVWREDLEKIIDETHRCKRIVAGLLNFARQQEMLAQEVDVHEMLEQAIRSVDHQASFKQVQIIRQFASGLPAIQADPAQLTQVAINLLNNAAEAMPQGGTITIHTCRTKTDTVEVGISDTGCGIPEENLKKLFTPFFTTKPVGRGTGLGLSIIYGIIKMHRGQIGVTSQVGGGTTFTINLPLTSAQGMPSSQKGTEEMIQ